MSFVFAGAMAILLFVAAPVAAHLLRVRRAEQRPFPPAGLVPASPPTTQQRRKLEDRVLFIVRALAVVALALLGATPLLQCSRLALGRTGGANVAFAIVIDDSMSMRARDDGKSTRFARARQDALDLLAGAQKGDAVAVVLAGDPVRVSLAPTTDLAAAVDVVENLRVSDRATDLDGAIALSSSVLSDMPQPQKRVVLLSDRCDGRPDREPIGHETGIAVWVPMRPQSPKPSDCAIVHAEQREGRTHARIACSGYEPAMKRSVVVRAKGQEIGKVALDDHFRQRDGVVDVEIPTDGRAPEATDVVLVDGADLIVENDRAPVAHQLEAMTVGVFSDPMLSTVETGGPPPVEQALTALQTGALIQPIPIVPDTVEDLSKFSVLVLDDPAGLTPEARDALSQWISSGGVAMVGFGPSAAHAPLGATLDPLVPGVPRWVEEAPDGAKPEDAAAVGPSGASLLQLNAKGRAQLDFDRLEDARTLVRWTDDAPFVIERRMGRGMAYLIGLPFNPSWSDLPFRPAFLAVLTRAVEAARGQGGAKRIVVGRSWVFDHNVEVRSLAGHYSTQRTNGKVLVTPNEAGRYDMRIAGEVDSRFAVIAEREVNLRPRTVADSTQASSLGSTTASVDISQWIALVLLALLASELVLRIKSPRASAERG